MPPRVPKNNSEDYTLARLIASLENLEQNFLDFRSETKSDLKGMHEKFERKFNEIHHCLDETQDILSRNKSELKESLAQYQLSVSSEVNSLKNQKGYIAWNILVWIAAAVGGMVLTAVYSRLNIN